MIFLQIKDLAMSYIKREDTLILVVASCNADLATTKALRLANEVDQYGERTIGKSLFVFCFSNLSTSSSIVSNTHDTVAKYCSVVI